MSSGWTALSGSSFSLQNTILAKNAAATGPDAAATNAFSDLGGNLIGVSGSGSGNQSVNVTRAEGDRSEFQVVATDRAGNSATSQIRRINFPFDDANAGMTYTGTWATTGADSLDYLGTLHTSSDTATPATVSFTFQGSSVGGIVTVIPCCNAS